MSRPCVLVIGHTYVVDLNRRKFDTLAQFADVSLLVPTHWRDTLRDMPLDPLSRDAPYQLLTAATIFNGRGARFCFAPNDLWRVLHRVRPALVHLEEEPFSFSFLQVALFKRLFHFRLCFFTWENIAHEPTPIERFSLLSAEAAIAGNHDAARLLRAHGFRGHTACVPQLGVDIPTESVNQESHGHFRIGYVGRLVEAKGLLVLFAALRELCGAWELQLVGDGPLRATLQRIAHEYGIAERVRFVGALPHHEVAAHWCHFDVLVLPSLTMPRWKEQFGHVLIEAMAHGVPVIGSDSGAIPDVIGDAGLIVPERNADALRTALSEFMQHKTLREQKSQAGRKRVMALYTHEHIAHQTWDIWRPLLP